MTEYLGLIENGNTFEVEEITAANAPHARESLRQLAAWRNAQDDGLRTDWGIVRVGEHRPTNSSHAIAYRKYHGL